MNILDNHELQQAFGASDCAGSDMRSAINRWFGLYYDPTAILQLPYTIVRKLVRAVFSEYAPHSRSGVLEALCYKEALEQALIGGECYLKPVFDGAWRWRCVPRNAILIFERDPQGLPTDVGMTEENVLGRQYFTLLERRTLDEKGYLTIQNRLFRSGSRNSLGREVSLKAHPAYAQLPGRYTFPHPLGSVGLVQVKTPISNCIDGSREGVSVYAAAQAIIAAAEENEAQLQGEFRKGQSRLVVSRDMLSRGQLEEELFVALDESPEIMGITVFAPQLREQSYLTRQQAYLRAVENIIGLKRGLLSQVEAVDRTATEITSSEGEYMTTVMELQRMFEKAAADAMALVAAIDRKAPEAFTISWGDGVLNEKL